MDIKKIDRNFQIETDIGESDVVFYDVRKRPFEVYGLYNYKKEKSFCRLPADVAKATSEGVQRLALCTAGGRVRFATDSRYIAIKAEMPSICHMHHMAMSGSAGFDLYVDDPVTGNTQFHNAFLPPTDAKTGYESKTTFPDRRLRYVTIHFPTYSPVRDLYIGLQADATVTCGMKYLPILPFVTYGSSITQGGCSSRPGNAYQNIISQRMNIDHINLGFSGNGKGEVSICEYMATLPMSVFISDYDHNAPDVAHLKATHQRLYDIIRDKQPDIPYIMISRPNFNCGSPDAERRREVIWNTYCYARAKGDRNVYFIDGESFFRGPYHNLCTVDGCHPNDMGFALMADAIEHELKQALTKRVRS